jgi:hypothetical protein
MAPSAASLLGEYIEGAFELDAGDEEDPGSFLAASRLVC